MRFLGEYIKKRITIAVCVCLLLGSIISGICLCFYPIKTDSLRVQIGCAKADDSGAIQWTGDFRIQTIEQPWQIGWVMGLLRTAPCKETTDDITDMELVEFSFVNQTNGESQKLKTIYVAYDFYLQKTYLKKGDSWYSVGTIPLLDQFIVDCMGWGHELCQCSVGWRGQSTFAHEEFAESDFEDCTFRYNLHWIPEDRPTAEEHDWRNDGFQNTAPTSIQTKDDAIKRAAKELGYQNPVATTFYDETCGYWMVELFDDNGEKFETTQDYWSFLYDNGYTVIMNAEGITLEVYQRITRAVAFPKHSANYEKLK